MEYQIQLVITTRSKNGKTSKELPTFMLPDLLGLLTAEGAKNVVLKMFDFSPCEIHGTVLRLDKEGNPDPLSILFNEKDKYLSF